MAETSSQMERSSTVPVTFCPYCGVSGHSGMCPRIKEIEYFENGTVKRVVFN